MARTFGDLAGGILILDVLVEEHPSAINADLIDRGLRLRYLCRDDRDFTWLDLRDILNCAHPDSAIKRDVAGDDWWWQLDTLLLADMTDSLRWLVWAKTKAAHEGRGMPDPIPRPGIKDRRERIGSAPVSIAEMNEFLGWDAA